MHVVGVVGHRKLAQAIDLESYIANIAHSKRAIVHTCTDIRHHMNIGNSIDNFDKLQVYQYQVESRLKVCCEFS
jgi:hypothetical protein